MEYDLRLKPKAEKALRKLPKKEQKRIETELLGIAQDPFAGKKLLGKYKGAYSVRVWPYRIIYEIYKKRLLVVVIDIGHRQGAYK